MKPANPQTVRRVLKELTSDASAVTAAQFPLVKAVAANPGLYSWWADAQARAQIGASLDTETQSLIYVGQTGATQWPSAKKSTATLADRIGSQHIRGNESSSTFRLTLSAILFEPLGLRASKPGHLAKEDRNRVSAWIGKHLRIVIAPYPDRDSLEDLEHQVLRLLDPPLNLKGLPSSPARTTLKILRKRFKSA